ncbi:MAG: carboxypeptidase-like regulatory domain-containing protein [Planctomycetaceae bacterium]|jgi:hypothetical protein|nr:carboxypeptidase-like regulatory domain-containing protein [Planctomycetaceae bacterium]
MLHHKLQLVICWSIFLGLFNLIGCQSEQRPDGLPDLVPFQLIVTQDNQPCIGAGVQLVSPEIPFPVTGQTDANGVARLVTYGRFSGVPQGTYKVVVIKTETEGETSGEKQTQPIFIYSLVDPSLTNRETTTLEITVEKSKKSATLDVGKSVRVLIDTIKPDRI